MKVGHVLWLFAAACGDVSSPATDAGGSADAATDGGAGFVLRGPMDVQYLRRGDALDVPVTLEPALTTPVTVELEPIAGVTAAPVTIAPGATTATLHLTTTQTTPFARARVHLTGTASATVTAPFALDILGVRGTLDPTFGVAGVATFAIAPDAETFQFALGVGNEVIVGATVRENSKTLIRLVRRTDVGATATTYGTNGAVTLDVSTIGLTDPRAVAASTASGGLVVAGAGRNANNVSNPFVFSLDANGQVLTSKRFDTGTANVNILAVAVGGNAIVLAGSKTNQAGNLDAAVLRLSSATTLDAAFGTAGVVTLPEQSTTNVMSLALQSDGKIVALVESGVIGSFTVPSYSLRRFGTTGQLDGTFGASGKVVFASPTGSPIAYTVVALPGNELLVGGSVRAQSFDEGDPAIWRLLADGSVDPTFAGGTGYYAASATTPSESIRRIAIGEGGVIYGVGPEITSFLPSARILIALGAAGAPIMGIGPGGIIREDSTDLAREIIAAPDHRLHVIDAPLGPTATTDSTIRTYFQ